MENPKLLLIAVIGPNGSGKSTIIDGIKSDFIEQYGKKAWDSSYINADNITRDICLYYISHLLEQSDHDDEVKIQIALKKLSSSKFLSQLDRIGQLYAVEEHEFETIASKACDHVIQSLENIIGYSQSTLIFSEGQQHSIYQFLHQNKQNLITGANIVAANVAQKIRLEKLKNQDAIIIETVMSHPSKLEFLKAAKISGYEINLFFIATESPDINVSRGKKRVKTGGHDVPKEKIIVRYFKTFEILSEAIKICDTITVLDNSKKESELNEILNVNLVSTQEEAGKLISTVKQNLFGSVENFEQLKASYIDIGQSKTKVAKVADGLPEKVSDALNGIHCTDRAVDEEGTHNSSTHFQDAEKQRGDSQHTNSH